MKDQLTLFGGICVQNLLPNGTVDQLTSEVRRTVSILSIDGGYILAPAHNIQADTPIENVLALFE